MPGPQLLLSDREEAERVEAKIWERLAQSLVPANGDVTKETAIMVASPGSRLLKLKKLHQWLYAELSRLQHAAISSSPREANMTEAEKRACEQACRASLEDAQARAKPNQKIVIIDDKVPFAVLMTRAEMISFEAYMLKIREVRPTFEQGKDFLWQHWTSVRSAFWDQKNVYVSAAEEDIFAASSELLNDVAPGECVCGAPATAKCGKCQCVGYCSRVCQKIAWSTHKKTCKAPSSSTDV